MNTDYVYSLDNASDLYQVVPVRISAGTPTASGAAITHIPHVVGAARAVTVKITFS